MRVLDARKKSHFNVPLPTIFPGQGCKESLELTRNILRKGGRSIMVSRWKSITKVRIGQRVNEKNYHVHHTKVT